GILDADETGKLTIKVINSGEGDAFDVVADLIISKKMTELSFDKHVTIGTVPSGTTLTKEIELRASEELPTDTLTFEIDVKEANGFDPPSMKLSFQTKAFVPPNLAVVDVGISDQAGGSKVEPGKIVEATVRVQNLGHGDARNVKAEVRFGQNVFMAGDSQSIFDLGNISSGQFKDVKFLFYTNNRIKNGDQVPVSIQISEVRPKYGISKQLALVMNTPQKSSQEFVVKAVDTTPKGDIQIAGGLSVDVDQNIPEGEKAGKYDVAVIIGNRNYSVGGTPNVDYANRDAQTMRDYLIRTMGYDSANLIYAEDAGLSKFYEIFGTDRDPKAGKLFKWVKPGQSRVFIYYVGHGAPDIDSGEAYFVPVDANPQLLKVNGYRVQTFYDNLAKIPAQKITVVLDACFSGNSAKGSLLKGTSALVRYEKLESKKPDSALVLTSSSADQVSSWYPEKRHSLFTYFFLKGLQGEADYNKDGRITAGELRSYLAEHVPYMARRLTGNEQTPQVSGSDGDLLAVFKK
ncbi:MAG: caspase family protein, partial [Deltaproteobacteria bacterium]